MCVITKGRTILPFPPGNFNLKNKNVVSDKHGIGSFFINKNISWKGCPGLVGSLESSLKKISIIRRKWDIYTGILPLRAEAQKGAKQQTRRSWRKKSLNAYGSRNKYHQKSLGSSKNLCGHRNKSPNRRAHTEISETAIRNAGKNLDFIRKLCNGDLLPLPSFLLGHRDRSPRSRTRWGAGEQHWNSFWYKAMAEKLYQQRERDTRFLFLHKRLIQGVSRGKPDSEMQALPTHPLEKVDVGFLPWLWSSCRGRRIKSPNMLCIFAKEVKKKLMIFFFF